MNEFLSVRSLVLMSIFIYMMFDFLDGRRVKDEREELIRLKSLELAHKVTLGTLTLIAFAFLFGSWLSPLMIIVALILAALYTEIVGKIIYRLKL